MASDGFSPVRIRRTTVETDLEARLSPRVSAAPSLDIPNRVLSHFLDHFAKGSGIEIELTSADWPGSWELDHVLCEDIGQLVGRGVAAILAERAASCGAGGRASASTCMDDSASSIVIGFESRARCQWQCRDGVDVDGFVDSWYGANGVQIGHCTGTNLRQFFDGFAYGSGASMCITVQSAGNLHHLYETVFRNLGDAVGAALGTVRRLPGESSGLAGPPAYEVTKGDGG